MAFHQMQTQAERDVRGAMLLEKIAEAEKVTVSKEEVDGEIGKMAEYYRATPEELRKSLEQQGGEGTIENNLRTRKSIEALIAKAKVADGEWIDEKAGETLDRIPAVKGEIRLADRAFLQPDRMASVLDAGADLIVRAGWRNARWLDVDGEPLDLLGVFRKGAKRGLIDQPIWIGRKSGTPLQMRLVAIKKPPQAADAARRKARREAQKGRHQISQGTLAAADWVILVTSLSKSEFSTADILELYRLRWRIELAFKRLKSLIGLKGPPGTDERSAKPFVLAHLLMILLLEPLVDEFEDSPPVLAAA